MSTIVTTQGCPNHTYFDLYFVLCCLLSQIVDFLHFFSAVSDFDESKKINAIRVIVGLRDAVFYGFPYKVRPKPKIALLD